MSLTIPVGNTIVEDDHSQTISEVTTNTFVINLQQAIFDLEVDSHQYSLIPEPAGGGNASPIKK
ncbi:Ornithine carbamoyltransferase [Legionella sainthelensi]|nr:hypothetical protein [Legionella sainthelensi]VEH36977.1 Ornithine carbamoyltransferase [Legionella sainthelensi]